MPDQPGTNDTATTSAATPLGAPANTSSTMSSPALGASAAAPLNGQSASGSAPFAQQGSAQSPASAMASPHLPQHIQAGQSLQQRSSPMPGGQHSNEPSRSSVPPPAASPALTAASTSSNAMTPLQSLGAQAAQNGSGQAQAGAQGNGLSRAPSAAADDRGAKRIKTEHDQSTVGTESPHPMPPSGFMGYPGNPNMPMMMPGYGPQGSIPPGSMPPNGFPQGAFIPQQGMMPFASSPGNGNGQFGYMPPQMQMQMQMQGFPGGPPGNMGPPMWMPGYGPMDPQQQQQMAGSSASTPGAGPSTPMQSGETADGAAKPPKQRKPRVKKEPGEKGKGKGKKGDGEAEGGNGQGETPAAQSVQSPEGDIATPATGAAQDGSPPAETPQGGDPTAKPKGKRGPKTDKDKGDKVKKPRKKKDKGGEGDTATPGLAGTPGAGAGTPAAIPDEISVVQSLLASTGASSQLPLVNGGANESSLAATTQDAAATGEEGAQANGATAQPMASAVEASGDNVDALQDLLAGSGVDLRAEERAIQSGSNAAQPSASAAAASAVMGSSNAVNGQTSPFYLELYALSYRIHRAASKNGLRVEPEVLMYLSSAAKLRFRNLLEAMVSASRHRAWSSHTRPPPLYPRSNKAMYHEELLDDPQKLLNAITRVEKAEEQAARQRRMQRDEQAANAAAGIVTADADAAEDGAASGLNSGTQTPGVAGGEVVRGKKTGASAAARNMTEDKRLKLANITAAKALGIKSNSKSWMLGASSEGTPEPAKKKNAGPSRLSNVDPKFPRPSDANGPADADANGTDNGVKKEEGAAHSTSANNPGGWGDLTARRRHREEEERRRARLVNLDDAMHALEMERSGGAGRGSGERALYMTRALGRPFLPASSSSITGAKNAAAASSTASTSAPAPGSSSL